MIDTGLVIDGPWIRKILAGEKTWEIRSKANSKVGRIALCEKGGPIVATATIGPSIDFTDGQFDRHFNNHRVSAEQPRAFYGDRPVYAWPLSDVRKIDPPIRYKSRRRIVGEVVRQERFRFRAASARGLKGGRYAAEFVRDLFGRMHV